MSTKPTKDPLADLAAAMNSAIETWKVKNSPESIERTVHAQLDKSREEITKKLLGFDIKSSGNWGLDHCNGRAGESAAGVYMLEQNRHAVREWLKNFQPPPIDKKMVDAVIKDSNWRIQNELQKMVIGMLKDRLHEASKEIVDSVLDGFNADKYLEIKKHLTEI